MKNLLPLFIFLFVSCDSINPILEYQQKLISDEVTGSNIFKLVKNGEVVSNRAGAAPKAALQSWIDDSI